MRTRVTQSSLASFDAMKGTGFAALQALILAKMKHGRIYSRRQIAKLTKLETSTVSGRCFELISMGAIEVCGTIQCPISSRHVEELKRTDEQPELFA